MNARVLELLKKPEEFLPKDFQLIEKEIKIAPYTQSLRALYLYGIKKHNAQYYTEELSRTAAYTTDKKILYQFINGKQITINKAKAENKIEETLPAISSKESESNAIQLIDKVEQDHHQVESQEGTTEVVNTDDNKISIEKTAHSIDDRKNSQTEKHNLKLKDDNSSEENNLIEEIKEPESNEVISEESPKLTVDQSVDSDFESTSTEVVDNLNYEIQKEAKDIKADIDSEISAEEISFHENTGFLSNVKVDQPKKDYYTSAPVKQKLNRHEEERKRLLAEVEEKIKKQKAAYQSTLSETQEEIISDEVSFSETQEFNSGKNQQKEIYTEDKTTISPENTATDDRDKMRKHWSPMTVATATPDALLGQKKTTIAESFQENNISKPSDTKDIQHEANDEDRSVMNLSFFSPEIKTIETAEPLAKENSNDKVEDSNVSSNVSTFINTWQNWLKIDRTEEIEVEKVEKKSLEDLDDLKKKNKLDTKSQVIDKFINEEPKISQLKEDSEYTIRKNTMDISHLMTETLVRIYIEQKLYAKAIAGYKILIEKHPNKKEYFLDRIEEVKSLRNN